MSLRNEAYVQRQAKRRLAVAQQIAPTAYHALGKSGFGMVTILKDSEPAIAFSSAFVAEGAFLPIDEFGRIYRHRLTKAMQETACVES